MAIFEFLTTDANAANDQGNFPGWEIVSVFFKCDFEKHEHIILYILYISCFGRGELTSEYSNSVNWVRVRPG